MQQEPSETPTQADESSWLLLDDELSDELWMLPKYAALREKRERDAKRLREELCGVPFYAKQAKAWEERTGDPMGYWRHSLRPNAYGDTT